MIQGKVNDLGGFIENIYNNYVAYDLDYDNYYDNDALDYKAMGILNFTIEVKEKNVEEVIDILDQLCKDNHLIVTEYEQRAYNYHCYNIVDEYDDDDYRSDTISKADLKKALEYTDIEVKLTYYVPRAGIVRAVLYIKKFIENILNGIGDILTAAFFVIIFVIVLFFVIINLYKVYKKMVYKYKKKHPEYYEPKIVLLRDED